MSRYVLYTNIEKLMSATFLYKIYRQTYIYIGLYFIYEYSNFM